VKAVVQRVARASVTPGGSIGHGLCVLLGVADGDDEAGARRLAEKVARLRIFENDDGKFDRSLLETGGGALVVSQFTLIAETAKGNRPSFSGAARPEVAEPVYEAFAAALRALGVEVATGVFGARMQVELVNDGPVTIVLQ
jgi:D-tyrosyl-tRNA(Tyr) deacylase